MHRSKSFLLLSSIIGIFLLVYGTSVIMYFWLGNNLMVGGITNLNYALLALLCLAPFVFYLLFAGNHANRAFEVIVASGILFCLLFVPLHFVLVFDGEVLSGGELLRLLTTLPAYAFMLVPIAHFMLGRK